MSNPDAPRQGRSVPSDVQNGPVVGVDVLLARRCFTTGAAMTLDVLGTANTVIRSLGLAAPLFRPRIFSPDGNPVLSTGGLALPVDGSWGECDGPVLVVCGPGMADVRQVIEDIQGQDTAPIFEVIRGARLRQSLLAASCSSTFLLAEAGVLAGLGATTSWWLGPTFRERYPAVALDEARLLVDAGQVVTAGAAFAHADLMLHLVRRLAGPTVAETCARYLAIDDTRRAQAPFRVIEHMAATDPAVALAESKIRQNPAKPPALAQLARMAGLTQRTLSRRFVVATGLSPKRFIRRVQLEMAAHLLRSSDQSVEEIAVTVGYDDPRAFRRAFQRELGAPPSRYRRPPQGR